MDKKELRDDLSFVDSWKEKDIELAAGAAIVVGAGMLGAKGKLPDVGKYGKQALGQASKGLERYIKRSAHPIIRNGYNIGSKAFKGFKKVEIPKADDVFDEYMAKAKSRMSRIDESQLNREWMKRYDRLVSERKAKIDLAKSMGTDIPDIKRPDPVLIKEQVRQEMLNKMDAPQFDAQGRPKAKPIVDKRDLAANFVGSGIAAVGFGTGLTAFHAANNALTERDKNRDRLFEAAGSTHKSKEERGIQMNKQAGAREIHDSIAGVAGNFPKAVTTGLGFTGVSLGSAHLLNKNKQEEGGKNRIIIELGEDNPTERSDSAHATAGGLSLLPRAEFNKSASFNSFLKNLGGRSSETNALDQKMKNFDYNTEAANALRGRDVDALAKNRFGHIYEGEKAREQVRNMEAAKLKNADLEAFNQIKDEVARDRLTAGAGLGIAGIAGGTALASRQKGEQVNGGPIY